MNVILVLMFLAAAAPGFAQSNGHWQIKDAEAAVVSQLEGGMFSAKVEEGKFLVVWAHIAPTSGGAQSVAGTEIEISGSTAGDARRVISTHPAVAVDRFR